MVELRISNLDVFYGDLQILWGISLMVKDGEVVSILGSNGAGKTTLLKTICGVIKPRRGTILLDGKRIDSQPPNRIVGYGIMYVPEGRGVFPKMTVYDNLMMGAYTKNARKNSKETLKIVFELFPILKERRNQPAGTLSGGEQQMLAIGRALMAQPSLLLLDEPSMGLSPMITSKVYESIVEIKKSQDLTILLVEQDVLRALSVSERCYLMESGRIVLEGRSEEIKRDENIRKVYLGL